MRKILKSIAIVFLLLLAPSSLAQGTRYLSSIEVRSVGLMDEGADTGPPRKFMDLSQGRIKVGLELGETIEGQEIILHSPAGSSFEFMVEQRNETSLTVMDEGPHLDLRDWKHYYSPWRRLKSVGEIKSVGENRFRVDTVSDKESLRFPLVSPKEIRTAVRHAGGARWALLVRNVKGPHDYPSAISLSKIQLRISVRESGRWKVITTLDFLVAMGC